MCFDFWNIWGAFLQKFQVRNMATFLQKFQVGNMANF